MNTDWSEIQELFGDLLELGVEEREDVLLQRTSDRPGLREAVVRLLAAHEKAEEAFPEQLDPTLARELLADAKREPESAGPYRLVHEVGRGGMGTVYEGRRADGQFDQRVAVKMLKRGMDSEAILDRFLRERQILAGFEHPSIARLIDGGIADDGRPFIVMEYVEGVPIAAYCDRARLSIEDRLELVKQLCDAVGHAHRKLVVHRDLKPSNILVTPEGVPKLLDFGIAKLLDPDDSTGDATTDVRMRMMTPEYAAPEQLLGLPVTTATDVYGLGAVLLELLSAKRPPAARGGSGDEGSGALAALDPLRPARALDGLDSSELEDVARARRTDGTRLRRYLTGDLGTIVSTALQPEPEDRYPSASALRDDIARYQASQPITARPPTVGYRVSRFVGRHRLGVSMAAAIAMLIVAFAVTATAQALRIQAQSVELEAERDRARAEAAAASEVADFVVSVFEVSDPVSFGQSDSVTARSLLDRGAERVTAELGTAPDLRARMQDVIANAYRNLGLFQEAEPVALASVDARREAFGDSDPRVARSLQVLARVQTDLGEFERATATLQEAQDIQSDLDPGDPAVLATMAALSRANLLEGDHLGASETAKEVAARLARALVVPGAISRQELWEVVHILQYSGDWGAASAAYDRLAEMEAERLGAVSIPVAVALHQQAIAESWLRNSARADSLYSRALDIRDALSPNDVITARLLYEYGEFLNGEQQWAGADSLFQRSLDVFMANVDPPHVFIGQVQVGMGRAGIGSGRFAEAAEHYMAARVNFEEGLGPGGSSLVPVAVWRAGEALWKAGRVGEGEAWLREAVSIFERDYPDGYLLTANARRNLGELLVQRDRGAEAYPILEAAFGVLAGRWGEENWRADGVRVEMAHALIQMGRVEEAGEILEVVLPRLESELGSEHDYSRRARLAAEALER